MTCIRYADGYKYQLRERYRVLVEILPDAPIITPWIWLSADGWLTLSAGYAWDGASWCPDVASIIRPSLGHDALYQLMREGHLDRERHREFADRAFYRMCLEDGMPRPLAWVAYQAVRWCADPAADPAHRSPDKRAGSGCSDPPLPT